MRGAVLRLLAAAMLPPWSFAPAAELTALPPPSGEGAERGVAVVRCAVADGNFWLSRGAILEVAVEPNSDVLLTSAHGLPRDDADVLEYCRVVARGRSYAIRSVWRSRGTGPANDWAVLVSRRLSGDVQRLRPGQVAPEVFAGMMARGAQVRMVLRYAGTAQSDCRLEQRASTPWPLVPHSCLSYAGMSGSPLVMGVAGEPLVVGLHVGSQIEFDGSKLDFVRIGRALDAEIGAAIAAAAQAVRPPRR